MKLLDLRIGVSGEQAVSRKLGLASEVIGDMRDIWDTSVHPFMLAHMRQQFRSDGAHGGKPWADFSNEPKYTAYKIAMVGHLTPLRWQKGGPFERLYPSLVDRTDVDHVWRSKKTSASFGTRVPHAATLNVGGIGPFGEKYKARKIIAMRDEQRKSLISTIQRAIVEQLGADTIRRARAVI